MKKFIVFLSTFVLFLIPFSCDECTLENNEYRFYRTLAQGNYTLIDLNTSPAAWHSDGISTPPKHAQFYQLDADGDQNTYVYFYRADTAYIGYDTTIIWFSPTSPGGSNKKYVITINTIEDTTGNN